MKELQILILCFGNKTLFLLILNKRLCELLSFCGVIKVTD